MRTRPPNILVAGLGLTLIGQHLSLRSDVARVKIVELNEEVIEMVSLHLPRDSRFEVIYGDFFDVLPQLVARGEAYDTIIMDVWTGEDSESISDFRKASRLVQQCYPRALHLYHSFQKAVDMEVVNSHLPHAAEGPLSFVPDRYSVEELRRRQAARKKD